MELWLIVTLSSLTALGAAGLLSDWLVRRRTRALERGAGRGDHRGAQPPAGLVDGPH